MSLIPRPHRVPTWHSRVESANCISSTRPWRVQGRPPGANHRHPRARRHRAAAAASRCSPLHGPFTHCSHPWPLLTFGIFRTNAER
ncbi:hypothetical protein NY08_4603 [Rhodococcus sp. B7740]|nr:hypothetical protein NY08_4603 [Rhodococcus sp. B7740]